MRCLHCRRPCAPGVLASLLVTQQYSPRGHVDVFLEREAAFSESRHDVHLGLQADHVPTGTAPADGDPLVGAVAISRSLTQCDVMSARELGPDAPGRVPKGK